MCAHEGDVVLAALVGGFADDRRVGRFDDRYQELRGDLPGTDVGVAVRARTRRVPRVIAVHQVDAAGDRLDAIDRVDQRLARRPGVAGVEAKPDTGVADVVPEPRDRVEVARYCVIATGRIL
jgi:hypothetical protein